MVPLTFLFVLLRDFYRFFNLRLCLIACTQNLAEHLEVHLDQGSCHHAVPIVGGEHYLVECHSGVVPRMRVPAFHSRGSLWLFVLTFLGADIFILEANVRIWLVGCAPKKRKRDEEKDGNRKKLRALPTFASYEDYAKMIEDGPEDNV